MSLGRTAHGQDATGVRFLQDCIAGIAAFRRGHLLPEGWAVSEHGRNTELGILLRVNGRGMNKQDRARVLVDDVANAVIQKLGLTNLRCSHHDDVPHLGVGKCVHWLLQIWGTGSAPRAGFGGTLRRQAAFDFCPLADREIVRRRHAGQSLAHRSV